MKNISYRVFMADGKLILRKLGIVFFLSLVINTFTNASEKDLFVIDQQSGITGVVVDESGEPVIGANVIVKGNPVGTVTDIDGNFSLDVPSNAVLVISYIGYVSQEVPVGGRTHIQVVLVENLKSLEEVVVVGYGVQKKKLVTGATVQVKGDDISKLNTVNVLGALQSQAPGVNITKNNGKPGEGFKVVIRGLGTIGNSDPLYIIDGMVGGDINLLNPSDIESVDILKDAASTAIYGARAANGVILVTTKKGIKGKPTISLDAYVGWQNLYKMAQPLNAQQYAAIMNEGRMNDGLTPWDFSSRVPNWDKIESGEWTGTNWLDEITNKNAPQQNYALSIAGGTEQSVYSMGIGYTSQEGLVGGNHVNSKYERYNGRINSDHVLLKNSKHDILTVGETMNFSFTSKDGLDVATGGVYYNDLHNALTAFPFMPVYDENGNYHKVLSSWNEGEGNPAGIMHYQRGNNLNKSYVLRTNWYVSLQPIEKLIIRSAFGINYSSHSYRTYTPSYDMGGIWIRLPGQDNVHQAMSNGFSWVFDNTASYEFKINNDHNFVVLIGTSAEKWGMGENLNGTNVGSEFDDFKHAYLNNTKTVYTDRTSLGGSPWGPGAIVSYFGRINYDYKGTYMATFNMRADGSSNFARGHRWGYFPSISAGWVITNEAFMESTQDWLDFFKIRGSWGKNGNMNIDNFQYLATIAIGGSSSNYFFGTDKVGQSVGSYPDILANPDVTWEKSEQVDIGFDSNYLGGRLGFNFDWYIKTTKDWLVRAPILASYGTGAPYINGGDVRNRGFEMVMTWNDRISDVRYGVNVNLSHNKNKVLRIANEDGIINGSNEVLSSGTQEMYRAQVGYPLGYFYGYKTAGIFQNEAEVNAYVGPKGLIMPDAKPGDVRFVDVNGNGEIDVDDRTMIGNPHPDYILGLTLNAAWKGFDISIIGNGTFGNQIAKSYRQFADRPMQNYTMDVIENRWYGEGTSNRIPRITSSPHINWSYISDIYVEDGDYFRISNLTVGYDFKNLMKAVRFQQLRLYATVQNLYTFTKYSGMDPEIGYGGGQSWASGIDLGYYPGARTFIIGANIKF